jgi:hypothetical protein
MRNLIPMSCFSEGGKILQVVAGDAAVAASATISALYIGSVDGVVPVSEYYVCLHAAKVGRVCQVHRLN